MVTAAIRILRDEFERLDRLEDAGLAEAALALAANPILAQQLRQLDRERDDIADALGLLDPTGYGAGPDAKTGELFPVAA